MKSRKSSAFELVKTCCRVLEDKKAGELQVLEVGELSSITDYLIIATATSDPHLRAMRMDLEKMLKDLGTRVSGVETAEESGWTVIDLFDVMIHLFRADVRSHYGLENLWKDAKEISLSTDAPVKAKIKPKKRSPRAAQKRIARRK
jgi:ribosome-associated protein